MNTTTTDNINSMVNILTKFSKTADLRNDLELWNVHKLRNLCDCSIHVAQQVISNCVELGILTKSTNRGSEDIYAIVKSDAVEKKNYMITTINLANLLTKESNTVWTIDKIANRFSVTTFGAEDIVEYAKEYGLIRLPIIDGKMRFIPPALEIREPNIEHVIEPIKMKFTCGRQLSVAHEFDNDGELYMGAYYLTPAQAIKLSEHLKRVVDQHNFENDGES